MQNIVIGTAGHIDHGKTTLVQNLTGINTDTLPEEAKRGMTINLGFTYFSLSNGEKVGIVDVPGHEKFIKNMVAGATGIDYVLFVIACDDGIMPQTLEHAEIIELLGVKKGLVILTKRDLSDSESISNLKLEIQSVFKNSPISTFPVIEVSSKDPKSYENLKKCLEEQILSLPIRHTENNFFKMSIDRVFSVKGFGTVVTGTSSNGSIQKGEELFVYPQMFPVKVKGIENHGEKVEILYPGNRCALNLSGVDSSSLKRGDILAPANSLFISNKIDCSFYLLSNKKPIKNNQRIRLHIGTCEIIGRIKILGCDLISPGKTAFIQIDLENNLVCTAGDIGIVRNFSPMETIGKIKIISPRGEKTKRNNTEYIRRLENLHGDAKDKILEVLKHTKTTLSSSETISYTLGKKVEDKEITSLCEAIVFSDGENLKYIHIDNLNLLKEKILTFLKKYHNENPLKNGIPRSEVRTRFFQPFKLKEYNLILEFFLKDFLTTKEDLLALKEFKIKLSKENKTLKDEILKIYKSDSFSPRNLEDLETLFIDTSAFHSMHNYLKDQTLLIPLDKNIYVLRGFFLEAEKKLREHFKTKNQITLGEFKNIIGCSRKFALLYLEKFDELKITKRIDDYRILREENIND